MAMTELPASLAPAEPLARAIYETGWRPALTDGPGRDELLATITAGQTVDDRRSSTLMGSVFAGITD